MALTYLERFGSVSLPTLEAEHDLSTDETLSSLEILPHGAIDIFGSDTAPGLPTSISASAILHNTTLTTLQTTHDALRALQGKRQKLYMRLPDDSVRWRYARFRQMQVRRDTDRQHSFDVDIRFDALPGGWFGSFHGPFLLDDGIELDDGFTLDSDETSTLASSPHGYVVTNGGNRTIEDAVVSITAGSADITSISVYVGSDRQWTYSGTIAAGQTLVVDCGNWSVKNNGTDDYANLTLLGGHARQNWLPIDTGANSVTVQFTGGSTDSTIQVDFSDGWV